MDRIESLRITPADEANVRHAIVRVLGAGPLSPETLLEMTTHILAALRGAGVTSVSIEVGEPVTDD